MLQRTTRRGRFRTQTPNPVLFATLLTVVGLMRSAPIEAQDTAVLESAFPAPNATLISPPGEIEIRFVVPIDPTSTEVRLYGPGALDVPLAVSAPGPTDSRRIVAVPAQSLDDGSWTLAWSTRLADGSVVADSWPFRVAPPPSPGAAPFDVEWPAGWSVAARWLATLGLGVAGGSLLAARMFAPGLFSRSTSVAATTAPRAVGALGATVALLAIAAQPLLLTLGAARNDLAPSLGQAVGLMPRGWSPALVATGILALGLLVRLALGNAADRLPGWADWVGVVLALIALAGPAASHAVADGPVLAVLGTMHAWASALWVGLLVSAAVSRGVTPATDALSSAPTPAVENEEAEGSPGPQRRTNPAIRIVATSWWLLAAALVSGLAAALLSLPRPIAWWTSTWGWSLIGKSVLVVVAALLLHAIRPRPATVSATSAVAVPQGATGIARPLVVGLAALSLLGGSLMALSATPGAQVSRSLAGIDLAAAVPIGPEGAAGRLDFALSPATPGTNTVVVRLAGPGGAALPAPQAPMVSVVFSPLDHEALAQTVNPTPNQTGGFAVAAVDLDGAGWWRADITLVPPDGRASRVTQYFVLPDPNVTGRGPRPEPDPAARAVFDRGMAFFDDLRSVRYTQRLGDGSGVLFQSVTEVADADGDRPATYRTVTEREELVIVGDTQWSRRFVGDGAWEERAAASLFLPSEWDDVYVAAQGFRLGPIEEVAGEPSRVVTFYLTRGESNAPAWYAWWVGEETGAVHREAMISQRHYMLYGFSDFGADFGIAPPVERQGPPAAGTQDASPTP